MRPRSPSSVLLAAALALLPACGGDAAALHLVLAPSEDVCTAAQLAQQVERLAILVDSAAGLEGVEGPGATSGGGLALDADGDGALEVLFQGPPLDGDDLPVLELRLASNVARELQVRVYGLPAGAAATELEHAVALGGATAAGAAGEIETVGVPFNLLAAARPPRVILVIPAPEAVEVPGNLSAISIVFSTIVEGTAAIEATRVIDPLGEAVPTEATVEVASLPGGAGPEDRTVLSLRPFAPLLGGRHDVVVSPVVSSARGLLFDQDASTPEPDAFSSRFEATPYAEIDPCVCVAGYRCSDDGKRCVPEGGCAERCAEGFVCDDASGLCVEDCRIYGACADPALACDPSDGRCLPTGA